MEYKFFEELLRDNIILQEKNITEDKHIERIKSLCIKYKEESKIFLRSIVKLQKY